MLISDFFAGIPRKMAKEKPRDGGGYQEAPRQVEQNATRIERQLQESQMLWENVAASESLVVQIGRNRRIEKITAAMDRLCEEKRVFIRKHDWIAGATAAIDRQLQRGLGHSSKSLSALDITDTKGHIWCMRVLVHACPHPFSGASRTLTLASRPARNEGVAHQALKEQYGLTPAEIRCALSLPELGDIPALAQFFDVSRETIRSQMRSIFAKTEVSSQAELTLLLAREGFISNR